MGVREELYIYVDSTSGSCTRSREPIRIPFDGGSHRLPKPIFELDRLTFSLRCSRGDAQYYLEVRENRYYPQLSPTGLIWKAAPYLRNRRGPVRVRLVRQQSEEEEFATEIEIVCRPSKITEDQLRVMLEEIEQSIQLLRLGPRGGRRGPSGLPRLTHREEWEAIQELFERMQFSLRALHRAQDETTPWGGGAWRPLPERMDRIVKVGGDPRWAFYGWGPPLEEPSAVPRGAYENRQIARFLGWLLDRLDRLAEETEEEIVHLDQDRRWSDHSAGGQPSIWEAEFAPRRRQLLERVAQCRRLRRRIAQSLARSSWKVERQGPLDLRPTPCFLQHPVYSRLYRMMVEFYRAYSHVFERSAIQSVIYRHDTDKLYEYWLYFSMLRYLIERAGLRLRRIRSLEAEDQGGWGGLRRVERSYAEFLLSERLELRLYYEPLIFPKADARKLGLPFYRTGGALPYSPDFVVEVLEEGQRRLGVVADAKYMREVEQEKENLRKYLDRIRDTKSCEPFASTLWIFYVGDTHNPPDSPCRVEVHVNHPVFLRPECTKLHLRGDRAQAIGTFQVAPPLYPDPHATMDQLDRFFRPLLRMYGISPQKRSYQEVLADELSQEPE
ncbi:MAG: hypothetical protein KatS3mg115_2187 [Candidatus Poribacteria bacterium]|nr:MAG: hypothetical protein KatS3mg115_2187 [Candidatus Poribacteria bacterium]